MGAEHASRHPIYQRKVGFNMISETTYLNLLVTVIDRDFSYMFRDDLFLVTDEFARIVPIDSEVRTD
jgi:glutathionylspermidine synthase